MKTRAQKQKDLEALTEQFKNAKAAMLVGFKGMTVPKDQELRNQLQAADHSAALELLRRLQNRTSELGPDASSGGGGGEAPTSRTA